MQTERVTFLTSPDHKAALDAFAETSGRSVGHVLREASSSYIAQRISRTDEHEQALDMILPELEAALAKWGGQVDAMEVSLDRASAAIDRALAGDAA